MKLSLIHICLDDRVSVVLQDYRDLQGRYDKLVSIEMIEAIGAQYLETYFAKVADLLAPHGRALIQAITIEDHRYQQALGEVDFIKRHIFPGSFIPSIEAMLRAKTRASDLALVHLEDFGPVSYTHLDVYKRQGRDRPGVPAPLAVVGGPAQPGRMAPSR